MKDAPGMRGQRSRNQNGELRQKRSDTHIKTIEEKYEINLHVNGNMHLGTYLKKNNINSLNDLISKK
ncbi:hypothetical protein K2X92_05755 [Candidatus Gracilibacteria bacterium]|nr:hypothetical protein [Candidatus Gracilibacteria bacterium]